MTKKTTALKTVDVTVNPRKYYVVRQTGEGKFWCYMEEELEGALCSSLPMEIEAENVVEATQLYKKFLGKGMLPPWTPTVTDEIKVDDDDRDGGEVHG